MSISVRVPVLGVSVVDGTVARWRVAEGEDVRLDQTLVELTTDKVDVEIPSPSAGVIQKILVAVDETVAVGAELAIIDESGAAIETEAATATTTTTATTATAATDNPATDSRAIPSPRPARPVADPRPGFGSAGAQVGTLAEVDMSAVSELCRARALHSEELPEISPAILACVVHALAGALRENPALNASLVDAAIVENGAIDIGIAVETDKGRVVPVLRDADGLSLAALEAAIADLGTRARSGKLAADELRAGTFRVTNPGRRGNVYGFELIERPQVGCLRMGEMIKRPVVRTVSGQDAIVIRTILQLALGYDPRAVGAAAADALLYRIRERLERAEFEP